MAADRDSYKASWRCLDRLREIRGDSRFQDTIRWCYCRHGVLPKSFCDLNDIDTSLPYPPSTTTTTTTTTAEPYPSYDDESGMDTGWMEWMVGSVLMVFAWCGMIWCVYRNRHSIENLADSRAADVTQAPARSAPCDRRFSSLFYLSTYT